MNALADRRRVRDAGTECTALLKSLPAAMETAP